MRSTIGKVWEGLHGDHRQFVAQLLRYGVAGVGVTLFQIAVYNLLSGPAHWAPLLANTAAFLLALMAGYNIHSRYSFQGHGERGNVARTGGRFLAASTAGFVVNSFWVWSFTHMLHLKDWTPSLPMFFVTPFLLFWLNRRWVFE